MRQAAHASICETVQVDFRALLGHVGVARALDIYKPMGLYSGMAIAHNFTSRLGLKGRDLEALAVPVHAFVGNMYGGCSGPVEFRERGAEVRFSKCPSHSAGASPEYCVAVSHNAAEGITKAINPDYEIIYTHHLTQGDPFCRYVVRRRSCKGEGLDDLGDIVRVMPPVELPDEERAALTISYHCSIWINMMRALLEVEGAEEVLRSVEPPTAAIGRELGEMLRKAGGPFEATLPGLQEAVGLLGSALGQEQHALSQTDGEIVTEVRLCALADGPEEACRQFEMLANGLCASLCPDCELRHIHMRTRGEGRCSWVIRMRRGGEGGAPPDEPARILAVRYAKGEIPEEEFERKMAQLRRLGLLG